MMENENEYQSGLGKSSKLPPEIKGWNWGAFFLNWIWGIGNSTYIALLMFVPLVNIVMPFILGAKGNKWAWQNRVWHDVDHFKRTQRKWALTGFLLIVIGIPLLVFGILTMLKGEVFELSLNEIKSDSRVVEMIGEPIKPGIFVTGSISTSGPDGEASLKYSISGPKGEADSYISAYKRMGEWHLYHVIVQEKDAQETIVVVSPPKQPNDR